MDKIEIRIGKKTPYYKKFNITSIICTDIKNESGKTEKVLRMKASGITSFKRGDKIRIVRNMKDSTLNREDKVVNEYEILDTNYNGDEFIIKYPYRDWLIIDEIYFPEDGNKDFSLILNEDPQIYQDDIWKQDGRNKMAIYPSKNLFLTVISKGKTYEINGLSQYTATLMEYRKNGGFLSDEMFDPRQIFCYNFNKNILPGASCRFSDTFFAYGTKKIEKNGIGEIYKLYNPEDTEFSVFVDYMNIPIEITQNNCPGVWQEDLISSYFINEIKDKSIPKVIDMEKNCFEPYNISRKDNFSIFTPVDKIIIRPHFRKRTLDGWNTDDHLWWNSCEYQQGVFKSEDLDKGDRFCDMNFTLDDIKFQKNKLKQSFIRLSFYDKNDPLSQQLLYFSTVFMDTGKLFGKYTDLKNETSSTRAVLSNNNADESISENLRCEFEITDRNNISRSSEGFYIYLFPSLIEELYNKNIGSPIYMKIEFNHAGVGKTIPLILPKNGIPPQNYANNKDIETERGNANVFWDNDMKSYYDDLYVKLFIEYVPEVDKFVYRFGDRVTYSDNGRVAELNVFEPKIN